MILLIIRTNIIIGRQICQQNNPNVKYLKKASKTASSDAVSVTETVQNILNDIEQGGEATARDYAQKFDKYTGNIILTEAEIAKASAQVPEQLKKDIAFAYNNVKEIC